MFTMLGVDRRQCEKAEQTKIRLKNVLENKKKTVRENKETYTKINAKKAVTYTHQMNSNIFHKASVNLEVLTCDQLELPTSLLNKGERKDQQYVRCYELQSFHMYRGQT